MTSYLYLLTSIASMPWQRKEVPEVGVACLVLFSSIQKWMQFFSQSKRATHTKLNYWPNHFKISKVVVDKWTSGCRSITSSIYLKLEYLRYLLSDWDQTCFGKSRMKVSFFFRKNYFSKVTSGLADMTSLSFYLRISLFFTFRLQSQFGQSDQGSPYDFEVI